VEEADRHDDDQHSQSRASHRTLTDFPVSILSLDEDYCVIDKPHDVRMDGPFPVTVERLVAHWLSSQEGKWVHQLDFATSGVLCIARNRHAAAAAAASFAQRQTKKEYVAVLQGHVRLSDWPRRTTRLPVTFPESPQYSTITETNSHHLAIINRKKQLQQHQQQLKRRLEPSDETLQQQQQPPQSAPLNAITASLQWQEEVMLHNLRLCFAALQDIACPTHRLHPNLQAALQQPRWRQEWEVLREQSLQDLIRQPKARKQLRKLLAVCGVELPLREAVPPSLPAVGAVQPVELRYAHNCDQDKDNDKDTVPGTATATATATTALTEDELTVLFKHKFRNKELEIPFIYHLEEEQESSSSSCLVINIPVAELDNDFRMEPGHEGNPGKASITELHILSHAVYQGQPVTKVLYKPLTGRRHQLRIHSLAIGHPIVGDYTYNTWHRQQTSNNTARMMLHAHSLMVPFPLEGKFPHSFKKHLLEKYLRNRQVAAAAAAAAASANCGDGSNENRQPLPLSASDDLELVATTPLVFAIATDPFRIVDGELIVNH
jgi:23S rRNA-/tRNA-specific pseudouridylate synthase